MDAQGISRTGADRGAVTVPALLSPLLVLLALIAAVLAGYLAYLALIKGMLPPGCGSGSGCGEVLGSAWSKVLGLPVSLPACLVYLLLAALAFPARRVPAARWLLGVLAGAIIAGAVWFILLQAVVLKAYCLYCMVDHATGLAAALVALLLVVRGGGPMTAVWALAGLMPVLLMAAIQVVQPRPLYHLDLPTGNDFDITRDEGRFVGLLDGRLQVHLDAEPHLGDLRAQQVLALMVDYACPHCRRLHAAARELQEQQPERVVLVFLPTPIHPSCNPHVETVPGRFRESCELARLSLGFFAADPNSWADFDNWLFEPETPRSLNTARTEAVQRLGEQALERGLKEPVVERLIRRNINAFGMIPAGDPSDRRVPVTWSPGLAPVMGPVEDADALLLYLNGEE